MQHFRVAAKEVSYLFTQIWKPNILSAQLETIVRYLNATYQIVHAPDMEGEDTEIAPVNGSWAGVLGLFQRQEADLSLDIMVVTNERLAIVEFVIPQVASQGVYLVSKKQQPHVVEDIWDNFQLVEFKLWVLYFLALVVCISLSVIFFVALNHRLPSIYWNIRVLFTYIEALTEEGPSIPCTCFSCLRILATFFASSIFLLNEYFMANLQTGLIVESKANLIETIEDLLNWKPPVKVLIPYLGFYATFMKVANNEVEQRFFDLVRSDENNVLKQVYCNNPKFSGLFSGTHVLVLDGWQLSICSQVMCDTFTEGRQDIKVYVSKKPIVEGFLTPLFGKHLDPQLKAKIRSGYRHLVDAGMFNHWFGYHTTLHSKCFSEQPEVTDEETAIKWKLIVNLFRFSGVGIGLAVIAFVTEVITRPNDDISHDTE